MRYTRKCWAFLRTHAKDYGSTSETYRKLGPKWNPHLLCWLMAPGWPEADRLERVVLFERREDALHYAQDERERGRPVRVEVRIVEVKP